MKAALQLEEVLGALLKKGCGIFGQFEKILCFKMKV